MSNHQDWEPIVWKKESTLSNTVKQNESAPRELTGELCNAIQKARTNVKLSQQELAQKLQVKPEVIKEYENGKAIPNNAFIAKIEKILNTKLPRAKKKETKEEL
jgi:ribosome-binding protein aMBF1 (putative translation factor)